MLQCSIMLAQWISVILILSPVMSKFSIVDGTMEHYDNTAQYYDATTEFVMPNLAL